jgi:NAD(P)-dependent dehydrogenase (short-subunit alcohol dehydrogenase family)
MYRGDTLDGQTVLITGGGSGLGRAMAERFAGLGARVGVIGRRPEPLAETVAAIAAAGGRAAWSSADVRDPEAVARAVDAVEGELGELTALVNNAAGNFLAPTEDLSPNAFRSVVDIVLHGTFHATTEVGRRWIARGSGGNVLSIVTTYAWMGSAFVAPSAAAKAGVLALTRSLAVEWATYGIRANAIAPGPIPTEGAFSRLVPPEMLEEGRQVIPLGRYGEPGELADLAVYLLSPMARFITGEVVVLDGGEWLKSGQEFGRLTNFPREKIKERMRAMKPSKPGGKG